MSSANTLLRRDSCGRTRLHKTMLYGTVQDVSNIMVSLEKKGLIGKAIDMQDSCGGTPLLYAIYRSNDKILNVLKKYIREFPSINVKPKFDSIATILYNAISKTDHVPMRFVVTYLVELYCKSTKDSSCRVSIVCVLREALITSINSRNLSAIQYIKSKYTETPSLKKCIIQDTTSKIVSPIHYSISQRYMDGVKELMHEKKDVCITDEMGRNVFHYISETGDARIMKYVFSLFSDKKVTMNDLNNRITRNLSCSKESRDILKHSLCKSASYSAFRYPFTCVLIKGNNGKNRICKVPHYFNGNNNVVRTPIDVALYRYKFKILNWYAHIPCARTIVLDVLYKKLSEMVQIQKAKTKSKNFTEQDDFVEDVKGIVNIFSSVCIGTSECSKINTLIQKFLEKETNVEKFPGTSRVFRSYVRKNKGNTMY